MKLLQLFLPSLFPLVVVGQINIVNKSLVDTTKHQLYRALDNTIIISGVKTYKNIVLKSGKAKVEHIENTIFLLRPFQTGSDTLRLFADNKLLYTWPCIIDTIPYPIVRIADQMDTVLTVQQILLSPFLSVHFPATNWNHRFRVFSFSTLLFQVSEGNEIEESSPSNQFTERQIKIFRQLKKGDRIFFDNIRGGGPDSRIQKFPPFTVHIK
jgi:hypothetical protein